MTRIEMQEQVDCIRILVFRASLAPGSGSIVLRCTEAADAMQRVVDMMPADRRAGDEDRRQDPARIWDRRRGERRGAGG